MLPIHSILCYMNLGSLDLNRITAHSIRPPVFFFDVRSVPYQVTDEAGNVSSANIRTWGTQAPGLMKGQAYTIPNPIP